MIESGRSFSGVLRLFTLLFDEIRIQDRLSFGRVYKVERSEI